MRLQRYGNVPVTVAAASRIVRSSFLTSLRRYARSWGLWLLLLLAPIAARLWIGAGGTAIAINGKAPIMTSDMLGVSLGIVVSTLLLPAAFIYFRASVTRRQPWPIEEVTGGSRVASAVGHFLADVAVVGAALVALTLAGLIIGITSRVPGGLHPLSIAFGLWVIALPAVMMAAALRRLLDSLPWTRGAMGEVIGLALWITALTVPTSGSDQSRDMGANSLDLAGFVRPLTETLPAAQRDIRIGGGPDADGTIALDVGSGLHAEGYLASRVGWVAMAFAMTVAAGLSYQPHEPRPLPTPSRLTRWFRPAPAGPVKLSIGPPGRASSPYLGLIAAEFRLIGTSRAWRLSALLIALASSVVDYRHVAGPAALLLLIFGMTSHIGRSEQPKLLALTSTMFCSLWERRSAFVLAAVGWVVAMGLPAIGLGIARGSGEPLLLALATAGIAGVIAMCLGVATKSAFAPRLVLLIGWYVWLSL